MVINIIIYWYITDGCAVLYIFVCYFLCFVAVLWLVWVVLGLFAGMVQALKKIEGIKKNIMIKQRDILK